MRDRGQAAKPLATWIALLLLVAGGSPRARGQSCVPVTGEFVLTGLSQPDGNARNHEVGVCLPHFTLELTAACKLTLRPKYASNAFVSLLQVGEPSVGQPVVPRAVDGVSKVMDAISGRLGYYYLPVSRCPQVYSSTVKGAKLLASDVASVISRTLGVDPGVLSSLSFTSYGLTIAWKLYGAVANELSYTAISKTGGPTTPDLLAFSGGPSSLCPLLDINAAPDFDTAPRDGVVDAQFATLVGRVPRAVPGKNGSFVCAVAPAGGYVKARRTAVAGVVPMAAAGGGAGSISSLVYVFAADPPNAYLPCGSGGFLYKLGAVGSPGDPLADACTGCPRGSFSTDGASLCSPCAAGQYQPAIGQKTCLPCQYGYAAREGAARCMACFYGRAYCTEGYSPDESAFTCNSGRLPAGYSPEGGFSIVRPYTLPTNPDVAARYSPMFAQCTVNNAETLLGLNVSAECRVDVYVLGDTGLGGSICSSNAALNSISAYYTAPNILASMSSPGVGGGAAVGLYATLGPGGLATTMFAVSTRAQLPAELALPTNVLLGLTTTGWGYLGGGDNGQGLNAGVRGVAADLCPPGTTRTLLNGDGVASNTGEDPNVLLRDYCVPCGPGTFCDGSAAGPQNCPAGTFGPLIGAKSAAGCMDCPVGSFQDLDGAFSCQVCAPNTFASAPGATACLSCDSGYEVAASGSNACNPCGAGWYRDAALSDSCMPCDAGTASGQAAPECDVCLPGTFSAAPQSAECAACPRGSFTKKYGAKECTLCGKGTYNDARGSSKCKVCPVGTFNANQGSVSATDCLQCPMGKAGTKPGAAACSACNPGYFTNRNGQSSCTPCAMGFFSAMPGASSCAPCPKGSYTQAPAAKACAKCSLGFYAAFPGASQCLSCPPGSYTNATGASACLRCPAGTYSTRSAANSAVTCVECAAGSFSYAEGSTACTPCAAGQYAPAARSKACRDCPLGSYATVQGSARCLPCKAGYTTATTGADSAYSCNVRISLDGQAPGRSGGGVAVTR